MLERGFSDQEIRREVRSGRWTRVTRGAFSAQPLDDARIRHLRLVEAAVDRCSVDTVVSHLSAAVLHDLPVLTVDLTEQVEITRVARGGGTSRQRLHVRMCPLSPGDVVVVNGIPVTSLARTVVDVGRTRGFAQAVVVGDAALRAGLMGAELDRALADARHRPGVLAAARAVSFLDARSESPGESWSRALMHMESLPVPTLQRSVRDERGLFVGRPDFVWEQLRVIGEFDGRVKYGRDLNGGRPPEDVVHQEKQREDALRSLGWSVARWTWADLRQLGRVRTLLERAFATAGPTLLGSVDPDPRQPAQNPRG